MPPNDSHERKRSSGNAELLAELRYIVAYFRGGIMPTDLREWMRRADAAILMAAK